MRTLVVLQSRLNSSRLPAKALLTVAGRPVVVLAAQRAARTGLEVVVATSDEPQDDAVARAVRAAGIACFRGSLEDPLDRFAGAAADAALDDGDVVVRLTADNVVPDGDLIEELVRALPGDGYVRMAQGLPYGLGAEAFRVHLLRTAAAEAVSDHDREHVTPWIRRRTADTEHVPALLSGSTAPALGNVRCTIDTLDDYVVAEGALSQVGDAVGAPWHVLLDRWSDVGGAAAEPVSTARANPIGQGGWVLGTVQIGLPYGAANLTGMPDPSAASRLLSAAATAGVTHLDTARAYGESEARIGRRMAQGLSERVGVVTKVSPLDSVVDAPGAAALAAELSVERSLRALGRGSVDALLVHRWADWRRSGGEVAETLVRLRDSGVARLVGASLTSPAELGEALADERVGYVQFPFNMLDRRWLDDGLQEQLRARPDVVVTVRSVFLQGLLAVPGAAWPANTGVDVAACEAELAALQRDLGRASRADLALAYVRAHPFVTSVVLGADTAEQVMEQAALFGRAPLTEAEVELVHRRLAAGPALLVDPSQWRMSR